MTVEPLKLGYSKPSFKISFNNKLRTVTIRPKGRRRKDKITLVYGKADYGSVKKKLKGFMAETDVAKKLSLLADAVNIGSESRTLSELCFLMSFLWHYDWNQGEGLRK